jgi:hypothetical protein|nr:MAG TPA: DnaB-like helicase [Bacteriophage sp.]
MKAFAALNGKAFLYESEAAPKFQSNFGGKLRELSGRYKALVNNFNFQNVEAALIHIRKTVMGMTGNCVFGIDNVTDMFPNIPAAQIQRFIQGLKAIRRDMNAQGRKITFVVVTHANRTTGEAADSSLWQNLSEVVISIQEDKQKKGDDYKILRIEKSRYGALSTTLVHREMNNYMHFEFYVEAGDGDHVSVEDETASEEPVELLPITKEVEALFASVYIPKEYGYGQIYNDYKNKFKMKGKDDVRNAIERYKKRIIQAA